MMNQLDAPRTCGTCTLCCKVLGVAALQKPEGRLCSHCRSGHGCRIYTARPAECASFNCLWLVDTTLPDAMKPERTGVVLFDADEGMQVGALVDPDRPTAWREPVIFDLLQGIAIEGVPYGIQVLVFVAGHLTVVMPNHEVALGPFLPGHRVVYEVGAGPGGPSQVPILVQVSR